MRSPSTGTVEDSSSALFPVGRQGRSPESTSPVEGLRMDREPLHEPVMVGEVVELLAPVPPGVVLDATVGTGGHAAAIVANHRHLGVLGVDRDPQALVVAAERLAAYGPRVVLEQARFADLVAVVERAWAAGRGPWPVANAADGRPPITGALFDLGVSTLQLARSERGFSYRLDGPLDMRMDPTTGRPAAVVVNEASEEDLVVWLRASGEGRLARRIARAIVAARPIATTGRLAEVVAAAVPPAVRRRGHPAARAFQAIRIAINEEAEELTVGLPAALGLLAPGGRCLVIAYHSGEGRLVKAVFTRAVAEGCVCPPGQVCHCGGASPFRWVFRGSRGPGADEVSRNPRASSARLWAVERVHDGGARGR
jgi:16S rRNA (cytosine1402-N4)-methyltransferase